MNQEERRALEFLQNEGNKIDENEYRKWCEGKKRNLLWCDVRANKIVLEWKDEHQ